MCSGRSCVSGDCVAVGGNAAFVCACYSMYRGDRCEGWLAHKFPVEDWKSCHTFLAKEERTRDSVSFRTEPGVRAPRLRARRLRGESERSRTVLVPLRTRLARAILRGYAENVFGSNCPGLWCEMGRTSSERIFFQKRVAVGNSFVTPRRLSPAGRLLPTAGHGRSPCCSTTRPTGTV